VPEEVPLLTSSLTYAIGDIHGRSDLLEPLLDFVQLDANNRGQEPKVIFLGDIVDRGPDSKRCIELVISTLDRWPKSKLVLGNHDDWFLRVLGTDDPDRVVVDAWVRNGGLPTICNYDYEPDLGLARIAVKTECQHHLTLFERASLIEVDSLCTREFIRIAQFMNRSAPIALPSESRFWSTRLPSRTSWSTDIRLLTLVDQ
jgi:serine/threonine protein phosphatase 1